MEKVVEIPELRDQLGIFRDRAHAGEVLAGMLGLFKNSEAIVLGVPAGGVPVAAAIAKELNLVFDVAVVSKITLPWNTEAGYGAVAFDGSIRLNEKLLPRLGLSEQEIEEGIQKTRQKVTSRVRRLRGQRAFPDLGERPVILVDDGLASGYTLMAGVEALRKAKAIQIIIAVPTGHWGSVEMIAHQVDTVYCSNIRRGWSFAVADAYLGWSDLTDEDVERILKQVRREE